MLNVAILMGRLTAEPELKHTQSGLAFVRFTLAIDRNFKNNGEQQADFINIVAWRQTAEFVEKYFHKGQLVAVEGSIQTGSYTDQNGQKRYTTEVLADRVYFAEPKRDSYGLNNGNNNYSPQPQQYAPQQNNYNAPAPTYSNGSASDFEEIVSDDDLPF